MPPVPTVPAVVLGAVHSCGQIELDKLRFFCLALHGPVPIQAVRA